MASPVSVVGERLDSRSYRARIDGDGQRPAGALAPIKRSASVRHGSETGDADDRLAGRQRKRARCGNADAHAVKAARPQGHGQCDQIEESARPRAAMISVDHRHETLGMARDARLVGFRQHASPLPRFAADRRGHRTETGIEGEHIHGAWLQDFRHLVEGKARATRPHRRTRRRKPRLQRKFDLMSVPAKNSLSTPALSKPDIGPASRPSARAARMK